MTDKRPMSQRYQVWPTAFGSGLLGYRAALVGAALLSFVLNLGFFHEARAEWLSSDDAGIQKKSSEWNRLTQAMEVLKKSPSGQALLQETRDVLGIQWSDWQLKREGSSAGKFLTPSDLSRTDSVLTRVIEPQSGKESLRRTTTVTVRVQQPLEDIVLDLAHELTHAARSIPLDPYDPDLTAEKYILFSLRGKGGEVEAVEMECRVGLELARAYPLEMNRCRTYGEIEVQTQKVVIHREKILADFGAMGDDISVLRARLGGEWMKQHPWITDRAPQLVSSTGNAPYPLALLDEYDALNEAACSNSRKRVQLLETTATRSSSAPIRSPMIERTQEFLKKRCVRE